MSGDIGLTAGRRGEADVSKMGDNTTDGGRRRARRVAAQRMPIKMCRTRNVNSDLRVSRGLACIPMMQPADSRQGEATRPTLGFISNPRDTTEERPDPR